MSFVAEIIIGVAEVALEGLGHARFGGKRAPPAPTEPTPLRLFGMLAGFAIVFFSLFGLAISLHDWKLEYRVLTQPAALATIVSVDRKQPGSDRFTQALLNFDRQTPSGPAACRRAPARFKGWSPDFEVGKTVEVYPQPGSCYRPTYAPDVGNPRIGLVVSPIAFAIGVFLFSAAWVSFRHRTAQRASPAMAATAR